MGETPSTTSGAGSWYFSSLKELLHWDESSSALHLDQKSRVPFQEPSTTRHQRVLLCHDAPQPYSVAECYGTRSRTEAELAYHFREWSFIDDFVYFTHHGVSMPPPAWVEAAHRHHVRCFGSCVLEHAAGGALLEQLLHLRTIFFLAYRLARLAELFSFDGWLVNFEVEIRDDAKVSPSSRNQSTPLSPAIQRVLIFVSTLREQLQKRVGTHAAVIWYDALTVDGELAHQSRLNARNEAFFQVASAMYLDYRWETGQRLLESVARASQLNRPAKDIYVGIDVYGRGKMPGGGGFRTFEAFDVAWSTGASVALFAPAWTMQVAAPRLYHPETRDERSAQLFWLYQRHLDQQWTHWNAAIWAWKRFQHLCPPRVLVTDASLAVETSFWPGWSRRHGSFDLRRAQLQPSFLREWIASCTRPCDAERVLLYWMESATDSDCGWFRVEFPGVLGPGRLEALVVLRFLCVALSMPLRVRYLVRSETGRDLQRCALGLVTDKGRLWTLGCRDCAPTTTGKRIPLLMNERDTTSATFYEAVCCEPSAIKGIATEQGTSEQREYQVKSADAAELVQEVLIILGDLAALTEKLPTGDQTTGVALALANHQSKADILWLALDRNDSTP